MTLLWYSRISLIRSVSSRLKALELCSTVFFYWNKKCKLSVECKKLLHDDNRNCYVLELSEVLCQHDSAFYQGPPSIPRSAPSTAPDVMISISYTHVSVRNGLLDAHTHFVPLLPQPCLYIGGVPAHSLPLLAPLRALSFLNWRNSFHLIFSRVKWSTLGLCQGWQCIAPSGDKTTLWHVNVLMKDINTFYI